MSQQGSQSDPLTLVRDALTNLRFGEIVIAVHDGEVVQVSRTEKIRPANKTTTSKR